jgi:hypothetical protein
MGLLIIEKRGAVSRAHVKTLIEFTMQGNRDDATDATQLRVNKHATNPKAFRPKSATELSA